MSTSAETPAATPQATLERVRLAATRLKKWIRRTPTLHSHTFSESAGCEVFLKLENLQRTGSFKIRGAANRIMSLGEEATQRGLVAASAGNHAQGVALAARLTGASATIVMPEATPILKVRRTKGYQARVILTGESWDEAQAHAQHLAEAEGLLMVHPFDDLGIIDGQGTIALEILEDVANVDVVVVPVGGGGLLAGLALVLRAAAPHVRIVGVQAEGANPLVRSMLAGRRVEVDRPRTLADGIRVGKPGKLTWDIIREHVDELVSVTEAEIVTALVETLEKSKVVAEPAGVVGVAALRAGKLRTSAQDRVCCVVSGGNIDLNLLTRVIESGLAESGLYHLLKLRMRDVPGQLHLLMDVIAERAGNILDVQHYRAGWKVPVGSVDVEVLIETRSPDEGALIERELSSRGFPVVPAEESRQLSGDGGAVSG